MPPPLPHSAAAGHSEFPQPFGKYTLLRKLARGGMAELFLARKANSPKVYVIKRVLPNMALDKSFLAMFLTEAKVAAQLNHPNIIQIDALGREGTHIYQAMEYIDGIDLERLLKACGGKIPPEVMTAIGIKLCDALCYANRCKDITTGKPLNVVHRDVTPGNVMITRQGVVKLVDFGVAKATAQLEKTKTGVVKGKFRYMSPEQLQMKELDGRSDLFSVGVLLYETTTGTKPFDRPQVLEVIRALTNWDPPPPTKVIKGYPKAVSDVIMKALVKNRDRRFADGYAMRDALKEAFATFDHPQSIESFVTRFLPPPLELPPFLPAQKPTVTAAKNRPVQGAISSSNNDDDDDDDQKTTMGRPVFSPLNRRGSQAADEERRDDLRTKNRGESSAKAARSTSSTKIAAKVASSKSSSKSSSQNLKVTFDDWDAPVGDVNAPDPDVPQPKSRFAAALNAPSRNRDDDDNGPTLDAMRHRGRATVSYDDDDEDDDGYEDRRDVGAGRIGLRESSGSKGSGRRSVSKVDKNVASIGRKNAVFAADNKRRISQNSNAVGSWSRKEVAAPERIIKDKDDSWKAANAKDSGLLNELEHLEGKKQGNPNALRNLIIVIIILAIGGGILVKSGVFSSKDSAIAMTGGKGRIVVDGGQGTVLINGKSCPLPCIQNVDSGVPVTIDAGTRQKRIVVKPNETLRFTTDTL